LFQDDDTVKQHFFFGKQFSNTEKKPYRCLCPSPGIPRSGIIPREMQAAAKSYLQEDAHCSVIYKSPQTKTYKWPTLRGMA
jgi:hypothetical protein